MDKLEKRFGRIARKAKDKYVIADDPWQHYWQEAVRESLDEIVAWINKQERERNE